LDLLQSEGYKIDYFSYFNFWLFPVVMIARLKGKLLQDNSSDLSMPNKLINKILQFIFSSEALMIPKISLPFGVSLVVVASL